MKLTYWVGKNEYFYKKAFSEAVLKIPLGQHDCKKKTKEKYSVQISEQWQLESPV